MTRITSFFYAGLGFCIWTVGSSAPALSETAIRLTEDEAKCIVENIAIYLDDSSNPVIVVPSTCPNPATNEEIMKALSPQNNGNGLPQPRVGQAGGSVLVLLKSELKCLGQVLTAGKAVKGNDGLLLVSLNDC